MSEITRRDLIAAPLIAATLAVPATAPAAASEPQRWLCTFNECDPYVYDPLHGDPDNIAGERPIPPGVDFADLPEDWRCPVCASPKSWFEPTDRRWRPSE